jgi:hypothetical protein
MARTGTALRWAACAVLAVAAAVLAFSLTRDADAPAYVSAPPSATTDATPAAARPSVRTDALVRPDAARGRSIAAAEAFVRYYFGTAVNHLKRTGEATAVRDASSPSCTPCRGDIAYFASANGRNGRLTGAYLWQNVEVRSARPSGTSMVLAVDASAGRHTAVEKPGAKPKAFTGGRQHLKVTLAPDGKDWVVFDVAYR